MEFNADKGRFPSDIRIYNCGYFKAEPNQSFGPEIRTNWIIHFVESGEGEYKTGDRIFPVTKGQIFLVSPGNVTFYKANYKYPWSYYWFTFNGRMSEYLIKCLGFKDDFPIMEIEEFDALKNAMDDIIKSKTENDFILLGQIYTALGIIQKQFVSISTMDVNTKKYYITRAITFIENNYLENINSSMIAKHLNLERTYFSKLFKAKTGISPQRYITRYKVHIAAKLLRTTDQPINDIAQSVGFSNITYFYRAFRRFWLTTPDKYRKNNQAQSL